MATRKSKVACEWSIERLGGRHAGQRAVRLFMWTFTNKECLGTREARTRFSEVLRRLGIDGAGGVRVFEFHRDHGLHMHCIVRERLGVHRVRELWESIGGGRIHVCRVRERCFGYVAKYLCKGVACMKGMRLWACFGGFKGEKVKDVAVQSRLGDLYKWVKDHGQIRWRFEGAGHLSLVGGQMWAWRMRRARDLWLYEGATGAPWEKIVEYFCHVPVEGNSASLA